MASTNIQTDNVPINNIPINNMPINNVPTNNISTMRSVNLEIHRLFDPAAFSQALAQTADNPVKQVKTAVADINDGLHQYYTHGGEVNDIVYGRSLLMDRLLDCLYQFFFSDLQQNLALIAVGGYGRGELHPMSDIDLMLLLDKSEDTKTKARIEKFLMLLWDSRLEIGHSVRTLHECVEEAEKDITVTTNIMEARLLAGNQTLFSQMQALTGPDKIWDSRAFFQAKLEEQIQRNGKFNDTAYNLEPNIKESRGGLRDIQMIVWVAKRHFNASTLKDLVDNGFLLEDEYQTLHQGRHLLWRIRSSLHYLAGRREDRLLFDYQRQLADDFGFSDDEDNPGNQAIEQFMQQYYRTVMKLEQLNEMLLQHFREAIIYADEKSLPTIINSRFQVRHGYLEIRHPNTFKKHPTALLELFLILAKNADIQGVRALTIREIRQNLHRIDDHFRQSDEARKLFITLMKQPRGVTHELRRMNRYGVLAAYIPAFDAIAGQMQYDLFHAYTVDQHTMFVIRNLRRFSVPDFCHEFPLASGIFHHLKKPWLLYLAGLFHDIAKGRHGDHSQLGASEAYDFCISHKLHKHEAQLVSWLIASHLIMSGTAQGQDLSDPDVIAAFAGKVGSLKRLDYLYLLTVSDIRATNTKLWNSWKDKLLSELYHKTAALLNKGLENRLSKLENIIETQTDALRKLERLGIYPQQAQRVWKAMTNDYFQNHTAGEIVWHTSLISHLDTDNPPDTDNSASNVLIDSRINAHSNSIELMVYMTSRDNIFLDIVSLLSNSAMNIVSAHIVNCSNHFALETFRLIPVNIADTETTEAELEQAASEITQRLNERLLTPVNHDKQGIKTLNRYKNFDTSSDIVFVEKENDTRVKIETINRPGILFTIARVFADNNIRLLSASINTAGEKVIDYFYVTSREDLPLNDETERKLKTALLEQL